MRRPRSDAGQLPAALTSDDYPAVVFARGTSATMLYRQQGDFWVETLSDHVGLPGLTMDGTDDPVAVIGRPWTPRGVWVAAPGEPEDTVTGVNVRDVAIRAPSVGGIVVVYTRTSTPNGLYLSRR